MTTLPPYLLFDLDDTLLAFSAAGDACWETLCAEFAPRIGSLGNKELLTAINVTRRWYWSDPERHRQGRMNIKEARREIVSLAFEELGLGMPDVADALADAFTLRREELVQPFPGTLETLSELSRQGIRMALITNGMAQFQRAKVQRFDLGRFFDPILIESEFGVGKPDPRPFLHALHCLGAAPQEAWMIGDDLEYDIRPALALGLGTVWVDYSARGLVRGTGIIPEWIVKTIGELLANVEER